MQCSCCHRWYSLEKLKNNYNKILKWKLLSLKSTHLQIKGFYLRPKWSDFIQNFFDMNCRKKYLCKLNAQMIIVSAEWNFSIYSPGVYKTSFWKEGKWIAFMRNLVLFFNKCKICGNTILLQFLWIPCICTQNFSSIMIQFQFMVIFIINLTDSILSKNIN